MKPLPVKLKATPVSSSVSAPSPPSSMLLRSVEEMSVNVTTFVPPLQPDPVLRAVTICGARNAPLVLSQYKQLDCAIVVILNSVEDPDEFMTNKKIVQYLKHYNIVLRAFIISHLYNLVCDDAYRLFCYQIQKETGASRAAIKVALAPSDVAQMLKNMVDSVLLTRVENAVKKATNVQVSLDRLRVLILPQLYDIVSVINPGFHQRAFALVLDELKTDVTLLFASIIKSAIDVSSNKAFCDSLALFNSREVLGGALRGVVMPTMIYRDEITLVSLHQDFYLPNLFKIKQVNIEIVFAVRKTTTMLVEYSKREFDANLEKIMPQLKIAMEASDDKEESKSPPRRPESKPESTLERKRTSSGICNFNSDLCFDIDEDDDPDLYNMFIDKIFMVDAADAAKPIESGIREAPMAKRMRRSVSPVYLLTDQ